MSIKSGIEKINVDKINRMKYYTQPIQLSKYEIALTITFFKKRRNVKSNT